MCASVCERRTGGVFARSADFVPVNYSCLLWQFAGVWHMISYMPTGLPEEQCSRMNVTASGTENATILDYQLLYKLDGTHKADMLHSVAENWKASESFAVFKEHGSDQWSGNLRPRRMQIN